MSEVVLLDGSSETDIVHGSTLIAGPPTVRVIARQEFDMEAAYSYLIPLTGRQLPWERTTENSAELVVEFGGRVCYNSFGAKQGRKDSGAYITNILEQLHGSVLEHAVWSLLLTNVSRSLTHELVRHRHFSYSQESQRYVDESDTKYVLPPTIVDTNNQSMIDDWLGMIRGQHAHYVAVVALLETELQQSKPHLTKVERRKLVRETARSVLPNATATTLVVTGNARAFRHFIEMRGSQYAEPEIRRLAFLVLEVLHKESPLLFGDYTVTNGVIFTEHRSV